MALSPAAASMQTVNLPVNVQHNDSVQLRIVQPEHGGGSCNCWTVKQLMFKATANNQFTSDLTL